MNHALFFADLAIRQDDFGSILPEYSAVVFDEAHEIEDVASDYFGRQISSYRFDELARDTENTLRTLQIPAPQLRRHLGRLRERGHSFFEIFRSAKDASRLKRRSGNLFWNGTSRAYEALAAAVKRVETELSALSPKPEEVLTLARRAAEIRRELEFLLESEEKSYVYWYERRGKGVFLAATPIDVSQILREKLFDQFDTVVLTSATLAVGGRFDYLKQRLGILPAKEEVLPQEFDFREQALLYIPQTMPDVRDAKFSASAADEITQLLEISDGRAFCLFTSYAQMKDVHARVSARVNFPLLCRVRRRAQFCSTASGQRRMRCSSRRRVSGRAWMCRARSSRA